MREIKVRVWTGKEYRYPPPISEWDWEDCNLFAGYNKKTTIFEQYTGLKDMSGEDIYEGDILEHFVDFGPGGECGGFKIAVELTPFGINVQHWVFQEEGYLPGIIGNIHETPELMEDQKK